MFTAEPFCFPKRRPGVPGVLLSLSKSIRLSPIHHRELACTTEVVPRPSVPCVLIPRLASHCTPAYPLSQDFAYLVVASLISGRRRQDFAASGADMRHFVGAE